MAPANLELVRSILASWERGDYSSTEWQHPEIEFVIVDGPSPGNWTGAEGITKGWGDFLSAWDGFHTEVDEYRELDGERVLVLVRFGGRGKTSGLAVDQMRSKSAGVAHFRGGEAKAAAWAPERHTVLDRCGRRTAKQDTVGERGRNHCRFRQKRRGRLPLSGASDTRRVLGRGWRQERILAGRCRRRTQRSSRRPSTPSIAAT